MAPGPRGAAASSGGKDKYKDAPDAKHLFDIIGKDVYDQVKNGADGTGASGDAKNYIDDLKGNLQEAKGMRETAGFSDPCDIIKYEGDKLLGNNGLPCGNVSGKGEDVSRFSKESGGECDNKKIEGNKGKESGACAPYRRLSLCNKNFQNINNYSSNAKHDLLADVCMAANYEAQSLINYREQYDLKYPSSVSTFTMCTMLARSFADIGDIVRGRDLYLRDKGKRDKLEDKLKEVFGKIYNELTSTSGRNKRTNGAEARYQDDGSGNYYKLREDWWTANRATIWEALTCEVGSGTYFRATCSMNGSGAQARNKCRCEGANAGKGSDGANVNIVPTYFDYKKTKSSVGNLFQILQIPKSDYDIPTLKSSNRYIPYASERYKGKTYIYMEGDTSGDEDKYAFMSDTTDVTSSEREYEELDINDIYVPGSPKYKTLIEVVLEPSGNNTPTSDIPSDNTPTNKFADNEWNQLKDDFISNMLQNQPKDVPNNYTSGNSSTNTNITTTSRHNMDQKPFIMSIHDRNLFSGEEYNYDMSTNSGNNDLYSGIDPTSANHDSYSGKHGSYSGIDLINDALNGDYDIYDEMLKRKENELFGTQHHPKNITSNRVVTQTSSDDPIHNQLDLFHKWLDRHRNMCEQWNKNKKEELLDKLKEEWNKDTNSGKLSDNIHSDNKPGDIPSDNHVLNSDVSIQIDMGNPKYINQFTCVDSNPNLTLRSNPNLMGNQNPNLNLVENNINPNHQNQNQVGDTNFVDTPTNPTNVQIEMSVKNHKLVKEKYPIADVWDI
ncbi:hypothetical protein PFFVO_06024 [Plasmodium falciparum Vietnam Oak-Knoll (FVO)]|uniref:Plasmodium falciparum erythrocyte membrane protein-1 N-terminal segment domain-containing protein n=1 Tax=Plasmodium falciparum Vietnam Oak-Knoll (FVO) TaxID=1036723 RepID=A0A024UYI5_PLAFA|nr:hypothetical protein PFFVO_06024 [Plasmodium falciparum Vietnam Oak-Knoll (FVO)]